MAELILAISCPKCDRLTVDNRQHCSEKSTTLWVSNCKWIRCVGVVNGKRCNWVYGAIGWAGFQGGNA